MTCCPVESHDRIILLVKRFMMCNCRMWRQPFWLLCTAFTVGFWCFPVRAEKVTLLSVAPREAPIIEKKKVTYQVYFVFNRCPKRYYWYYEHGTKSVVLEFFDCHIRVNDSMPCTIQAPVKAIDVNNASTSMVISGQKAHIIVALKEEMLARADCSGDTLHLTLWKDLSPSASVKKKRRHLIIIPLIILLLCAGLTVTYFQFEVAGK
ncbi:MAG: hypothetical protein JW768_14355 [Chitinispirillaceae bacterium]|nr:hypothetical protein [Chitinispirillaceae bacterium]